MRRKRLPRYGLTRTGLNHWRVHVARTAGLTDAYLSRVWRTSKSSVRLARVGITWPEHPTPPDRRPRMQGRRDRVAVLLAEPVPTLSLARLIARMPAPSLSDCL
jgi:hypothetical protein